MIRSRNTLLALSLCAGLVPGAALAADNINGGNAGPVPLSLGIGTAAVNRDHPCGFVHQLRR
jgi:hypothetical protein